MPLRTSWLPDETEGNGAKRTLQPARLAKVKSIEATARILRPTRSSMARTTKKRLTGEAKAKAEARKVERKRRQLASVTKHNGRLTIPKSPKFQKLTKKKSSVSMLTMTSREMMEIDAIRKRVQEMRKKTQKYHEATTRSVLSSSSSGSTTKSSFAMALRSCGGLGVPAVRRAKLTQPVGFEFEIDKRLAARKRASPSSSSTATTISLESENASTSAEPAKKRLRL